MRGPQVTSRLPLAQTGLEEFGREIDTAVNQLKDWYRLLIRTSNDVFQVEYWSRVLGPTYIEDALPANEPDRPTAALR